MSRETLLDDAITKAKEAEDWQLVEWLRMARGGESAVRWYTEKLRDADRTTRKLLNENAKLRELVSGYADSFERSAAMNNGNGPYYSGEDWLSLANDMRFDLAEACGELGNEVDG